MNDIFSKFSLQTRNKFNELLISSSSDCETLDTYDRCYEKIHKSWWN